MIKYCLNKWQKNSDKLKAYIENELECGHLARCDYEDLLFAVIKKILNDDEQKNYKWDYENITEVDDGHWSGTLLFLIPENTVDPDETEYLMTFVNYGSCTGCDTLQRLQSYMNVMERDDIISDFMTLCRDLVLNMIKPYNTGWRYKEDFDTVEFEKTGDFDE